jgi:hypothetical protein
MSDFDDIFPHCSDCGGVDWVNGVCPECSQKLADLIDNYDGAPYYSLDNERESDYTPHIKQR